VGASGFLTVFGAAASWIYSTPKDPEVKKECDKCLKKRLEEIGKKNPQ
jgi:hypothetical protein